jgi:RNA-directed DNA polymerase
MTVMDKPSTGASPTRWTHDVMQWRRIKAQVYRLQVRIAKAARGGRHGKAKALQWLLTHSFHAKMLAVKRVVQNTGRKTPGVDKVVWKTPQQKIEAVQSLQRKGYKTQPLRRIYIPKKDGRQRPLGIPTMKCRAMQALHLLALEPIAEVRANKNSYGFRPKRSTADAIAQCFNALARKTSATWVLEADIKSCFDKISHEWLRNHIPMDKEILSKWLSAGYVDEGILHQTEEGTPQGGIISPTLLNLTLSGLEAAVKQAAPSGSRDKVHCIIYADDFVITSRSREVLEEKIKPVVESFLQIRGLTLSQEKTQITRIDEGFDFLGVNVRKYKSKLIMKPAQKNVQRFLNNVRETIRSNLATKTETLIKRLNQKIQGWANYHRHICAKETFSYVDSQIYQMMRRWMRKKHPGKSVAWRNGKYFRRAGLKNWVFSVKIKADGELLDLDLIKAAEILIKRHVKVRAEASPYDPAYRGYFAERTSKASKYWRLYRESYAL